MSDPHNNDRRQGPRVTLDAAAVIRLETLDSKVSSRIVNASLNGLLLAMPAPRPVGTRMHITVQVGNPMREIAVSGIIVHVSEAATAAPGFTTRVGVFLTKTGPDWAELYQHLVRG